MVELPDLLHPEVDPDPAPELLVGPVAAPHTLGPATVDSDADGRADTAVVTEPADPDVLALATDLDGDARVDVLTRVHADGTATTTDLPGEPPGEHPGELLGDPWDEGPTPPPTTIDPATGRWVRGG
ncbi:hypothetical protein [Actinomycetospora cinnamomea]|uniref:Uncharacterized protein n=1 Tax=Actinomycetospora cinnamomea TaxID=663609 RepID=A0A2U1FG34_9PSEU|nr:hypothetical protein [Actinomycetospora cinnamomea]PVZ11107.1 hypothetical protein C8D89_104321 [Actinomycetospora cinnamomea]